MSSIHAGYVSLHPNANYKMLQIDLIIYEQN